MTTLVITNMVDSVPVLTAASANGVKHQKGLPALHLVASCCAAAHSMLAAYPDAADFSAVSAASLAASLAACVAAEAWKCLKWELDNCVCHDNST